MKKFYGMNTIKSVRANYYDYNVGQIVMVHHHCEGDFNSLQSIDHLYTAQEHNAAVRAPSYSNGNDTTYYIGCGTITKINKNNTAWVKLAVESTSKVKITRAGYVYVDNIKISNRIATPLTINEICSEISDESVCAAISSYVDKNWNMV